MISLEEIKSVLPNALLIIRFEQLPEFGAAFCVDVSSEGQLQGLTLKGVRKDEGKAFFFKEHVVPEIFQPRVTKKGQVYQLQIQPLEETLDLICKTSTSGKCLLPVREIKKKIKVEHIVVTGQMNPLSMVFNLHGTYRASKEAAVEHHVKKVEAPADFTRKLFQSFTGNC